MSDTKKVVLGIYKTRVDAEKAVSALKMDGFSTSDISVLMPDSGGSQDFAHTKGTKAPEGAATGAGVVGAIGGVGGALIGMGFPEYEAKRYEGFLQDGGILLSVHAASSEEVTKAEKSLKQTGAKDISTTGEAKSDWKAQAAKAKEATIAKDTHTWNR